MNQPTRTRKYKPLTPPPNPSTGDHTAEPPILHHFPIPTQFGTVTLTTTEPLTAPNRICAMLAQATLLFCQESENAVRREIAEAQAAKRKAQQEAERAASASGDPYHHPSSVATPPDPASQVMRPLGGGTVQPVTLPPGVEVPRNRQA